MDVQKDLNEKLLAASEAGNLELVTKSMNEGAAVDYRNVYGMTALHWAAIKGSLEICRYLIYTKGANPEAKDNTGYTPLHLAARAGHLHICQEILAVKGTDPECRNNEGGIALHGAAGFGHLNVCKYLIEEKGTNPACIDNYGATPLHKAAFGGHVDTCKYLLHLKGIDPESKDYYDQTPYDNASSEDVKELIKKYISKKNQEPEEESDASSSTQDTEDAEKLAYHQRMGNAQNFKRLLSRGTYNSYYNCLYLCGACCVGKSTFASVLLDEEIPTNWFSTDGLNIHYGRNGIDLEKKKMVPLKRGSVGHDVFGTVLRGNPVIDTQSEIKPSGAEESPRIVIHQQIDKKADETSTTLPPAENIVPFDVGVSPPKSEDLNLKIQEEILQEIRTGKYKMKIAPSDLVDFGGQKSFDMTHQLFIRQKGSFAIMFDGRYNFDDVLPKYPQESKITTESIIKHWVDSILTYCPGDDNQMPIILFAATHKDSFSHNELVERQKKFTDELTKMFSNHEYHQHIIYNTVFFINTTDKTDPEIERMTSRVVEIAMRQKTWGQQMPMAWVPMELQISEMKKLGVNFVKMENIKAINKGNDDLVLTDEELEQYLNTQHSMGKIMFFPGDRLDKYIIIQPSALVNILRSFITDKMFWPKDLKLKQIHEKLKRYGKIYKQDLISLWNQEEFAHIVSEDDIIEYIIKILVHLDILVEPKRHDGVVKDFFLVPCMIEVDSTTNVLDVPNFDEKAICLSYELVNSNVPVALRFKVIASALSIWPFKEQDGRPMIFFKSAVLCVDDANELKIYIEERKILVFLINSISKQNISPDIAASIQECLTRTIRYALDFYQNCTGKVARAVDIGELFEIKVGCVCQNKDCLLKLQKAEAESSWTCERGQTHETRHPKFWIFDKTLEECPDNCEGLTENDLSHFPSDIHLVRLAGRIGIHSFHDLIIYLGLTKAEWEEIEYEYRCCDVTTKKFMALHRWQRKKAAAFSNGKLQDLDKALKEIGDCRHHLCQIFRECRELLGVPQEKLDEKILHELSLKIGNCAVHLGIELGLNVCEVEETIYANPKSIFDQTYDVLRKWKDRNPSNPLYILMRALQRVQPMGMNFLIAKYNINIDGINNHTEGPVERKDSAGDMKSSQPKTTEKSQLHYVLQKSNLLQYYDEFIRQGGDDIQQFCEAKEEEFSELMEMVKMKPFHIKKFKKALQEWKTNNPGSGLERPREMYE